MNKPSVSESAIFQAIDLEDLTGIDLSDFRGVKEAIGQAIVDKILERTDANKAYGGGNLRSPYSRTYQHTLEFKAAGKKPGDVNMRLTGDMLSSLDVESGDGSVVKVFIGDDQVPKAYNHIMGVTVPRRNFFGIAKTEMDDILDQFKDDLIAVQEANGLVSDGDESRSGTLKAIDFLNDNEDED